MRTLTPPGDAGANSRSVFKTDVRTAKNKSQLIGDKYILSSKVHVQDWLPELSRLCVEGLGWTGIALGVAELSVCLGSVLVTYWLRATSREPIHIALILFICRVERSSWPPHTQSLVRVVKALQEVLSMIRPSLRGWLLGCFMASLKHSFTIWK